MSIVRVNNYIDGQFEEDDADAERLDSYNPCTGLVWASLPNSDGRAADRAVRAAKAAFKPWAGLTFAKRAEYLMGVAKLLEERQEEFAKAESADQGKPVGLARRMDIPRAVHNLRVFAETWPHFVETANSQPEFGAINYSTRAPLGVVGVISPWNLPLYLLTFKIGPALMAGNTVVCKPSEMTTVTAWMLAKLFHEVGVPAGVFNLVCGLGGVAGEALVRHADVKAITFTGSTAVGERIAAIAAPMMKKLSLELGGKNPAIVFGDADLDKVIPTLVRSCFLNQGEICLCTSRLFVHESVFDELLERFVKATRALVVGDPTHPDTFMGALNSKPHWEKVKRYIGYGVEDGGKIHCGETVDQLTLPDKFKQGYFCQPTIITGLKDDSRCMQDEIFGPVVCVTPFSTESEAVERANGVKYGLCASVWSENVGVIHRVSQALESGTVWANCWLVRSLAMPFGGYKASGVGREGVYHSLEAYTQEKTVCVKIA